MGGRLERVTFNGTVETRGYVGFGLSRNGKMTGADIVIGGVKPNGEIYFSDRHAVGQQEPEMDPSQDWKLHSAWETATHTFLCFSRAFDTCDPQDYRITNDKVSLIWAFGEKDDEVSYHFRTRGVYDVHLLDADYSPEVVRESGGYPKVVENSAYQNVKLWRVPNIIKIPPNDTSYICSMHRGPRLRRKHHLIGFGIHFNSEDSETHTHHLLAYRCNLPRGGQQTERQMFEPWVNRRQQCLVLQRPSGPMPTQYCTELFHGWGVGGRLQFAPLDIGYPMGLQEDEYYAVQVHYNNPNRRSDIVIDFQLEFFYTSQLRPNEGGVLMVNHDIPGQPPSLLIPPSTPRQELFGHFGPECTQLMLPQTGILVYGTSLHSHDAGRQLRLQHFRDDRELPWLFSDDNYGFNFQNIRYRSDPVRVLPGDHLAMRCVYDSTRANGTIVGGFSTRQEMCVGFIHYYNKIRDFQTCRSEIDSEEYRRKFLLGVGNVTFDPSRLEYVVDSPHSFAGLTISKLSDNFIEWTGERREELQRFHHYHPHINQCGVELFARGNIRYLGRWGGGRRPVEDYRGAIS